MTQTENPQQVRPVLDIKDLKTYFFLEKSTVRALDGINLQLAPKSTLGVVGESGCGKSIMAMSIMRLIQSPPGKIVNGEINLFRRDNHEIVDIAKLDPRGAEMRSIRGGEIAIVFQEPMTSLNPLYTVGDQIAESVELHQNMNHKQALDRAQEMLSRVQISAPKQRLHEYPHQLSGGMRQRVMIALALSCNPSILIADEPTTALGCDRPGSDSRFDAGAAERFQFFDYPDHPQPGRSFPDGPGSGGDVSWQDRRTCRDARAFPPSAASIHSWLVELGSGARSQREKGAGANSWHGAHPDGYHPRLPV